MLQSNESLKASNISMQLSNESLISTMEAKIKILVNQMNQNFQMIFDIQEKHAKKIKNIEVVLHILGFSLSEPSSSALGPSGTSPEPPLSQPVASETLIFPTPSTTTLIPTDPLPSSVPPSTISHIPVPSYSTPTPAPTLRPSSTFTSSSTATTPPLIDPSSAMVLYSPPSHPPSFSSDITFPIFLPDNKGGE